MSKWKTYMENDRIIFLPEEIDESELIDITGMQDRFKRFLDLDTKEIHDCKKYYKMSLKENNFPIYDKP